MGLHLDDTLSPAKPWPGLTRVERQVAYRMIFGLPRPLTLEEAARAEYYRVPRARRRANSPAFRAYLAALEARRAADGE